MSPATSAASIAVLGPFEVRINGTALTLGERPRRILAALIDAGDDGAGIDRLAELVWDDHDRPDEPTAHVRTAISRLRRQINEAGGDGPALIERRPGGYRLGPTIAVDAWEFEAAMASLTGTDDPERRLEQLTHALQHWRGDPFSGFEDLIELAPTIARLSGQRLAAEEERLASLLALGQTRRVIGRAELLADAHPWREELRRLHALALYRSGRQRDALEVLRDYGQMARSELGLEPGPELVSLEAAILDHDAALTPARGSQKTLRGYEIHESLDHPSAQGRAIRRRATLPSLDSTVAIETIRLRERDPPAVTDDLLNRVRLRGTMRHPHLEPVVDQWRDPAALHVVTPLYARRLDDELALGPMALQRVVQLAAELGAALDTAHDAGLVHGALGPRSIYFDDDGRARLGGFPPSSISAEPAGDVDALARLLNLALTGVRRSDRLTIERMLQGCPDPETVAGILVDGAARHPRAGELSVAFVSATGLPTPIPEPATDNPYPGLASFGEAASKDFHGREQLVDELCRRWRDVPDNRLVVLVGASGSGKSSVLLAGLVPAVRRGAIAGSDRWAVAIMRPGPDPMGALADALAAQATSPTVDTMSHLSARGHSPSVDLLGPAVDEALTAATELLLVIDQCEELFSAAAPADADRFLDLIAAALVAPQSRLRVAASLRADWLDRPLQRQPIAGLFRRSIVPLAPLTPSELQRAIAQPAADRGVEIAGALRARLVDDVLAEQGALPLLNVALHELWNRHAEIGLIDVADYEEIGGLSGALIDQAEQVAEQLGPDRLRELRQIFGRLVTIEPDRRPVGRSVRLSDLVASGVRPSTIDVAVDARLLSVDRDPGSRQPVLSLAHEAIVERWPRLTAWLEEDRAHLYEHGRLAVAAAAWEADQRDAGLLLRGAPLDRALELEHSGPPLTPLESELLVASRNERDRIEHERVRQSRRQRALAIAASVVALVAVVAGTLAAIQSRRAEQAAATAEFRLLTQLAATEFDERPALGLHLALGALVRRQDASSESVLIDLLDRSIFDRLIGTAVNSRCMAMSPDPTHPAVVSFAAPDGDGRSAATLWSVETGESSAIGGVELSGAGCPLLAPGGARALVEVGGGHIVVDLATGAQHGSVEFGRVRDLNWTLDGDAIIVLHAEEGGRLDVYDAPSLRLRASVPLDTLFVSSAVATGPEGTAVVSSDSRPPLLIDLRSGRVRELADPGERVMQVALAPAGAGISGRSDINVMAWDLESGRLRWTLPHSAGERTDGPLAISERGSYVATFGSEGVVIVDNATGSAVGDALRLAGDQLAIAFAGDEELAVAGAGDRIYVLRAPHPPEALHTGLPGGVVSPDGAVTSYRDDTAIVIDPGGEVRELSDSPTEHRHLDAETVIGYEIERRRFVIWTNGVRAVEVDLSDRVPVGSDRGRTVRLGHGRAVQLVLQEPPDFDTMRLFVFAANTGEVLADLEVPDGTLAVPIASDAVALAEADFGVVILNLDGDVVRELDRFGHPITAFGQASDGDLLVGLGDGTLHRYDASTHTPVRTVVGPPAAIVQILPFASGFVTLHSSGDVVKWYDGQDAPAGVLHRGTGFAGFGSVSRDGSSVLLPETGRVVRVPLDREVFVAEACRRAGDEIDLVAWRSITGADPKGIGELCEASNRN